MYLRLFVCMYVHVCVCIDVEGAYQAHRHTVNYMRTHACICMYVFVCVCIDVEGADQLGNKLIGTQSSICARMHVCMHACMYVCIDVEGADQLGNKQTNTHTYTNAYIHPGTQRVVCVHM